MSPQHEVQGGFCAVDMNNLLCIQSRKFILRAAKLKTHSQCYGRSYAGSSNLDIAVPIPQPKRPTHATEQPANLFNYLAYSMHKESKPFKTKALTHEQNSRYKTRTLRDSVRNDILFGQILSMSFLSLLVPLVTTLMLLFARGCRYIVFPSVFKVLLDMFTTVALRLREQTQP